MPNVTDCVLLADGTKSLEIGGDISHTYNFTIPSTANLNQNAVMSLRLGADNPSSLSWNLEVNGSQVMSFTHSQDRFAWHSGSFQRKHPAIGFEVRHGPSHGRLRPSQDFGRRRLLSEHGSRPQRGLPPGRPRITRCESDGSRHRTDQRVS